MSRYVDLLVQHLVSHFLEAMVLPPFPASDYGHHYYNHDDDQAVWLMTGKWAIFKYIPERLIIGF